MCRWLAVIVMLGLSVSTVAQAPPSFKSSVDAVRLDVRVTDRGTPVTGLTASDFVVTDNAEPQTVDVASAHNAPLSVCLLMDTSGSLEGERLSHLKAAASAVVGQLRDADAIALFTFAQSLHRAVDFAEDPRSVASALRVVTADAPTALRDAVFATLQLTPQNDVRSVMLLFTDGIDNSSWLTARDVLNAAAQGDAVIHVVHATNRLRDEPLGTSSLPGFALPLGLSGRPSRDSIAARVNFLKNLASVSGGRYWPVESTEPLPATFTRALEDMRTRYVVSYRPRTPSQPGWHNVSVKLRSRRGEVVVRPRYWVPPSP